MLRRIKFESRNLRVTAFLVLNFGITWISIFIVWMYGISIPSDTARIIDYLPFLMIVIPTSFGPAIASFSVRKWITKEGFNDAGLNLNFHKNWKYYVFAWLFPLPVVFGITSLVVLTGLGSLSLSNLSLLQVFLFLLLSIITTPYIWGEEFGWRGYLQLRVYRDRPVRAALVTGLIHGIWHYPMILFGYLAADLPLLSAWVLYPLMTTASAFIYGWLRLKTGSIWPASLAHSASNNLLSNLTVLILSSDIYAGYIMLFRIISFGLITVCIFSLRGFNIKKLDKPQFDSKTMGKTSETSFPLNKV